jgi:AcrR family transcriptional regulator
MPAGRPPDPDRRRRTLDAVVDHVIEQGMDGLSLRPLAAALGTSPRMLLYDFGTKEHLVSAIVTEARARQAAMVSEVYRESSSARDAVRALWGWLIDPDHRGYVRLYAQVRLHAATATSSPPPELSPMDGVGELTGASRADLVIISTLLHGLALRRLGEADTSVVDAAFEHFASTVAAAGATTAG